MPTVEDRVDRLEQALENFISNVGIEFNKLYNSQMRTEAELRDVFPEYKKYKIIGILASLYADESIIKRAEKVGFLVLAAGDQLVVGYF